MSKIASFGEVMMRLEVPRYATLEQSSTLVYSFSGTGVNVVSALSRYGHQGILWSVLPQNALGDAAVSFLRRLGIQTEYVVRDGKYIGSYFLEHGFGVRQSRVTYSDRWGSSFNTADFKKFSFENYLDDIDAVHLCGITLAMNDQVRQALKRIAIAAKKAGKLVIFDCNYRPSLWGEAGYELARPHYAEILHLADIVFMNEMDAIHLLGLPTSETERKAQLEQLIPLVAKRYGVQTVSGTHRKINEDGTHSLNGYIFKKGKFHYSDPKSFTVYDRVGAGDAFASGIIHGELTGKHPSESVQFAVVAAMLAHTVGGDTPIATEQEILQAMQHGMRDVSR